jgi:hypothetical protein
MLYPIMLTKSATRRAVALACATPHTTISAHPQRLSARCISTSLGASDAGVGAGARTGISSAALNNAGASAGAAAPRAAASFWSKLSPTTRRNVKVAFAVGAVTDAYVAYHYLPNWLAGNAARKE